MSPDLPVEPGIGVSALTKDSYVLEGSESHNENRNGCCVCSCRFLCRRVYLDVVGVRRMR